MSARIDICNFALGLIGSGSITSLDDDSDEARVIKTFYYLARDAVLEDANWTFAIKRFIPNRDAADPEFGWGAQFVIPGDIVRVIEVLRDWSNGGFAYDATTDFPEEYKSAHVIEGNRILTNDDPIYCYGIQLTDQEGAYSAMFAEAFAYKLAYLAAKPLASSNTEMQTALGLYMAIIKRAKTRDSMQNTTRRMRNRTLQYSR